MNTYKYNDFEFTQGIRYEKSDYEVTRTSATKITSSIPTMNKETSALKHSQKMRIIMLGNYQEAITILILVELI